MQWVYWSDGIDLRNTTSHDLMPNEIKFILIHIFYLVSMLAVDCDEFPIQLVFNDAGTLSSSRLSHEINVLDKRISSYFCWGRNIMLIVQNHIHFLILSNAVPCMKHIKHWGKGKKTKKQVSINKINTIAWVTATIRLPCHCPMFR